MIRGTSPTIVLKLIGMDLDRIETAYVTFKQGRRGITKITTGDDVTITEEGLEVFLSQEDTLEFKPGEVQIQVRGMTTDNVAFATDIVTREMNDILQEGVIS